MDARNAAAPFYLHPAEHPEAWHGLVNGTLGLDFAVINVHNGPGAERDEAYYGPALDGGSSTPLVGYVDLNYGLRPRDEILREVAAWREWYGVVDIMLDRTPAEAADVPVVVDTVAAMRDAGAIRVILNPGRVPHRDIAECADLVCTVETDWVTYRSLPLPSLPCPSWHLVHSVPTDRLDEAREFVAGRGPAHAWVTDGRLPNPWSHLPGTTGTW